MALFDPPVDAVGYVFARSSGSGSKDAMTRFSNNHEVIMAFPT